MTHIKTLDEILADMDKSVSAFVQTQKKSNSPPVNADKPQKNTPKQPTKKSSDTSHLSKSSANNTTLRPKKSKTPQKTQTPDTSKTHNQNLADILNTVHIEPLTNNDKATNRLRWLAFYYLSRRELSQKELRQKLLAKNQDPKMVEELLIEFAKKGYQSDKWCAFMLIREAIRRGRGKRHIQESFYKHGIELPYSLDELIAQADVDSLGDGTILDDNNDKDDIDWLKLAVEARTKKYGDTIPTDPKEKAKQLRFLQYRGFSMDICFDALKMTLGDF